MELKLSPVWNYQYNSGQLPTGFLYITSWIAFYGRPKKSTDNRCCPFMRFISFVHFPLMVGTEFEAI